MGEYGGEVVRRRRAAYAEQPRTERFVGKRPEPPRLPTAVWINEPKERPLRHADSRKKLSQKG
jgi:hypothetical protein